MKSLDDMMFEHLMKFVKYINVASILRHRIQQLKGEQAMPTVTRYYMIEYQNGNKREYASGGDGVGGFLWTSFDVARGRKASIESTKSYQPVEILILDVVGTPLEHNGKMVGVVPL